MQKTSTLLKVVSIIMIVFGALSVIGTILSMVIISNPEIAEQAVTFTGGADLGTYQILLGVSAAMSAIELVAGILGVMKKISVCKVMGIILIVISAASLIFGIVSYGFQITSLIGLVLPILYYIGATQAAAMNADDDLNL